MPERLSYLLLMLLGGAGIAIQPAINARLRTAVEAPVLASLISFLVGSLVLVLVTASGLIGRGRLDTASSVPWWGWLGGALGAFYVTAAVVALPRIGSGAVVATTILGQLVTALVIDANGWFGVTRTPLSVTRVLGAGLLLAGVALLQRR